jgi:hypothetical protein
LDIDSSSIGLERISVQKTPIKVIVEGGETTFVRTGITRAAILRGQVVGYRIKNGGSNGSSAETDNKELFFQDFKTSPPKLPVEMYALLVIDERHYEQIRITFSEDYTDILFPGASVLVVLADILKPDIFEELAGKLDSEGRLSRRLLEQQGFITTFDPRRIVLSIAVPQTFRGTRIHRLSGGEPYGIANAVVELKSESETLYRIADNKGRFEFEELRPGKWILTINEESLPEYHYMIDKNQAYELKPGECREVSIHVVQKKRHIQIVEEKELPFGRLQTKSGEIRKNGDKIKH